MINLRYKSRLIVYRQDMPVFCLFLHLYNEHMFFYKGGIDDRKNL
nr:MAG TPA: hypothetical protein [Caudoviricetes sp.]